MSLEQVVSGINENIFFREFSFSRNKFSPPQEPELELADHVVWLDDLLITFQLKERNLVEEHTDHTERTWFQNKVLKKATKQIRDTLQYLNTYAEVNIENERGHKFNVVSGNIRQQINIILFAPNEILPVEYKYKKFHHSSTAGFIHLITSDDYAGIVKTLVTPAEISEYLEFRKSLGIKWKDKINTLPEQALVGQFLSRDFKSEPGFDFVKYLANFFQLRGDFDMSHIFNIFADRIVSTETPYQYYQILKELAKLNRNELREIKFRFDLCVSKCRMGEFDLPYRVAFPRTGCGFIFIVVPLDHVQNPVIGLENLTLAHKYEQHLDKCVGASFVRDGEYFDIVWCYIESKWEEEPEIEQNLRDNFPFRMVEEKLSPRYFFQDN